jgi:hypothetical protein
MIFNNFTGARLLVVKIDELPPTLFIYSYMGYCAVAPIQFAVFGFPFILFSICNLENLMRKRQLISLEQ